VAERLRVLVVDDDAPARRAIASFIARKGDVVREAEDGQSALAVLEGEEVDVVLSDVRMPKLDGIALTRALKIRAEDAVVVLMSAFATIDSVIAALREGAYDYIIKPIDPEQLSAALNRTRERLGLRRRVRSLTAAISARDTLAGLVSGGPAMRAVLEAARRASQSDLPVLITGETGTGKDLLARAIHGLSARAASPFVVVNASTTPAGEIDAELFGRGLGAPAASADGDAGGASSAAGDGQTIGRIAAVTAEGNGGKIRAADRGTLLIEELSALPAATQAKLLKLLEEKIVDDPSGGEGTPVDVRVVATAGEQLEEEVKAGRLRADLYYRLRVVEIHMPPLKDRREDIPHLVEHFLVEERVRTGVRYCIAPEALALLMAFPWPGNVRELENIVRAAVALARSETIEVTDLPPALRPSDGKQRTSTLAEHVEAYERAMLRQTLESVHGQVGRAAAALGMPERTLRRKMRTFGLAKEAFRKPARQRSNGGVFGA
jgi:DNA-binding NtrC family response regulator